MSAFVVSHERELVISKSTATIPLQISKLRENGLIIDDEEYASSTLKSINYYRLLHYFAVFLDESGQYYKKGTTFEDGTRLYEFDRKLRVEILAALEEVEVAARAAISNNHAKKYGALGYLKETSFDRRHNHKAFLNKIERMLDKNSDLTFVRHYNKKHGGMFPLWVMMEMFSFGMLVFFYQDLTKEDKKYIAKHYFDLDFRNVESWLESLADLRNHCAHYNRVYDNCLPWELRSVELTNPREYKMGSSLFDYLLAIKFLHRRGNEWGKLFVCDMEKMFGDYRGIVDPKILGFPNDWKEFFERK
jgi:abortive infection bacteriophage resistance protein